MAPRERHIAGFNTNEFRIFRQRTGWRFFVPGRLGIIWAYAALPMLLFGNGILELLVCVEVRHAIHYSTKTLQNGLCMEKFVNEVALVEGMWKSGPGATYFSLCIITAKER
jgi:hypothetical protein